MRYVRFLFVLPLLALMACDDDGITFNPVEPAAKVRFINLSEDPGTVDLRFIDRVENLPTFLNVDFRGTSGAGYQRVGDGTRHLRIFPNSTDPEVAQTRLVDDPAFGLVAEQRYTLVLTGSSGSHTLTRLEEPTTLETAPDDQIRVQVLHGAVGSGDVRVYVVPSSEVAVFADLTDPDKAAHIFEGVGELSTTGYANVPALDSGLYFFSVTDPADNLLFFAAPNQPGEASGTSTVGPQPGVQIEHSVLTAVLTPDESVFLTIDRTLP